MQHPGKGEIEARKAAVDTRWTAVQASASARHHKLDASLQLQQFLREAQSEADYLAFRLKALESTDYGKVA